MESGQDFRIPRAIADGLSEAELYWAVIEPIWPDIHVKDELAHIARGTPGQRAIYATTLFAREVDNGGLAQFFSNSSGMYTKHVEEGLHLLGAHELLKTFLDAQRLFPGSAAPIDTELRRRLVDEALSGDRNVLEPFDQRLLRGSNVEAQLYPYFKTYIDTHPAEFFLD